MNVGITNLKKLHNQGLVQSHHRGPTPDLVIQLFQTKPDVWRAELLPFMKLGVNHYSIRSIKALEQKGKTILRSDITNTMNILRGHFDLCDRLKIRAGANYRKNPFSKKKKSMILLWWD